MGFKLTVSKKDGSIYWQDYFDTLALAKNWVDKEMSKPYWVSSYAVQYLDLSPDAATVAANQAAIVAATTAQNNKVMQLKNTDFSKVSAVADVNTVVSNIIKLITGA